MKEKKLGELCDFISGLWTGKKPPYIKVGVLRNTNFNKDGSLSFDDIAMLDVEIKIKYVLLVTNSHDVNHT